MISYAYQKLTWAPQYLIEIDGCNLVRADHPNDTKRVGVCIYYKESLPARVINLSYFEVALLLEMTYDNKKVMGSVIYLSPSQSNNEFNSFLTNLEPTFSMIKGDVNARSQSWWSNDINTTEGSKVLRKERIFIKTFDKVEPTIKTVDIVQLKVLSPSKSVVIEAICMRFICSDILSQNVLSVASQYEHLQNLTLADSFPDGNKRIDVLVGVDYYYSCIGSEIKRDSGNQPLAISSIFGWILCGFV